MIIIALGSNMGDRKKIMQQAIIRLEQKKIKVLKISSLYETEPVGLSDQPSFLNAIIQVDTELKPLDLLHACLKIEDELGRVRVLKWGPRLIDLDLICYNQIQIESKDLILPHPFFSQRRFVLEPLMEIAADFEILPNQKVRDFFNQLSDHSQVKRIQDFWI